MSDLVRQTAEKLVANCKAGTAKQGLQEYYAADAVSSEAMAMPGEPREVQGVEAITAKHEWWENAFEVHEASVEGPYMHGDDKFSVIFALDTTNRETNERSQLKEIAVYHCNAEGKVTREEFFYTM